MSAPAPEPEPEPKQLTFRDYIASHSSFTSVLVNPRRKAHNHPFTEGGYYPSGYYPSDFVVPESTLPPVRDDALAAYMQTNAQAYAEYRASARQAAAEREEQQLLHSNGDQDSNGWSNDGLAQMKEHDEELRDVPDYFFETEFDLAVAETFEKACGTYTVSLQAPHEAMILQEQLSHYLDIVETRLLRRISQRSGEFFSALVELQRLQLQVQDAYNNVREVRSEIRRLEESVVAPGAGVVSLSRQRQNALATRELLELMATVRDTQANIQLLLGNEEYAAAMALIRSTQDILEGELKGVHSFRHLGAQLREYVDLVNRLRHGDLEMLVLRGAVRKPGKEKGGGITNANGPRHPSDRNAYEAEVRTAVSAISGKDLMDSVPKLTMHLQKAVTDGMKAVQRTATVAALRVCEAHGSAIYYVEDEEEFKCGGAALFAEDGRGWLAIRGENDEEQRLNSAGLAAGASALDEAEGSGLGTGGKVPPRVRVLSGDGFLCVLRHVCTKLFGLLQRLHVLAAAVEQRIREEEAEPAEMEAQSLRSRAWATCLTACAERANYFVVQLVTYRSTSAAHLPRAELARFCGLCCSFAAQSDATSGCDSAKPGTSRPGEGLRTASAQQAKNWMEREQATSLEKVQMMLDSESWSDSFVTVELPDLLNYFYASEVGKDGQAQSSWAMVDPADDKAVLVNGHGGGGGADVSPTRYRVIQSMLMILGLLRSLLDAGDEFGAGTMGKDVTLHIVALLRCVNTRTHELILGQKAIQTADLPTITAKNLAMAAQTLAMLRLLVPLIKGALDVRLSATQKHFALELDSVAEDLQAHHRKLRAKIQHVAEMVCRGACERAKTELPQFAASRPAPGQESQQQLTVTGAASPIMSHLVKQTVKLHHILVPLLPDHELAPLFGAIIVAQNRVLVETFTSMLESSKSARLAACVQADVRLYLKATQKLRPALTGQLGRPDGVRRRNANERLEGFMGSCPAFK